MSTLAMFPDVLVRLQLCGLEIEPSSADAYIGIRNPDEYPVDRLRKGRFESVFGGVESVDVVRATIPCRTFGKPSPETEFMTLTWQAPFRRFHDIDRESAELGFIGRVGQTVVVSALKDEFAEPSVRAHCSIVV
jgi:hypothetical protein